MTTMRRLLTILVFLLGIIAAQAQDSSVWSSVHFVRIGPDRVVVFNKGNKFEFERDVAWDLASPAQKRSFTNWAAKAGIPKDPGQFVALLPPAKEVPLTAMIGIDNSRDTLVVLSLKIKQNTPTTVTLVQGLGWEIDKRDRTTLKKFAENLQTSVPSLLLALSSRSGKVSEPDALAAYLAESESPKGSVCLVPGSKMAIWSHLAPNGVPTQTVPISESNARTDGIPRPIKRPPPADWVLPAIFGGMILLIVALLGWSFFRNREAAPGAEKPWRESGAFPVGAHERELILKVRDEGQRNPPPLNAPFSVEEYAVGLVLDKYHGYDDLAKERDIAQRKADALQAYKDYQEQHEEFEKRHVAATEALKLRESELATERAARKDLQEKLQQAETSVYRLLKDQADLTKTLEQAQALVLETEEWSKTVSERLNAQAAKIHHE